MTTHQCDIAIIGAGSAGMNAYRAATAHSDRVLLIEGGVYGTTCARVGCMPSKLLIAAAHAAHVAHDAGGFGVRVGSVKIDGAAVMQRVRAERDRFVGFVVEDVESWPESHRIRAQARFEAPGVLGLSTGDRVHAERVVIATGSSRHLPDGLAPLRERLDSNETLFEWEDLPESVAVIGSGVIALELGQALHRLGVRTRVLGRSARLGGISDPVIAETALVAFGDAMPLLLEAPLHSVEDHGTHFDVVWEQGGQTVRESFARVLNATGQSPNLGGLNLTAAGVALDERGMPTFDEETCQIKDHPIFIAGDATDDKAVLHEASDEGRIAGDNAGRWPDVVPHPRRTPLSVVFCEPQIMSCGASHAELVANGTEFVIGTVDFSRQGRARVMRENVGRLNVYAAQEDGRLLGAAMVGPSAEHIGHLLAWSVQSGLSVTQALQMPFYHPVIEEGLRTALRAAAQARNG